MRNMVSVTCCLAMACVVPAAAEHTMTRELSEADKARLVLPQDLVYKGAFLFPKTPGQASRWGYGGAALTYCPKGDPEGPEDGHPGSLFGAGHAHHNLASEVSIPLPVISPDKDLKKLPAATTLQPFADITGGLKKSMFDKHHLDVFGGVEYLPKQGEQAAGKLHWCFFYYYNVSGKNHPGYGWSDLDLANPNAVGVWHCGPYDKGEFHARKTGNYLFEIPVDWAKKHAGGKRLATGNVNGCGLANASYGPSLYAIAPWEHGNPPAAEAALDAAILLLYPGKGPRYPDWGPCDHWEGGAWLTAGGKSAVAFIGTKGANEANSYYGLPKEGAAHGSKGYHADPYETQFIFYDPDELAQVAEGKKKPHEVVPYVIYRPVEYFWPSKTGGTGACAFDRERGLLYVVQSNSENPICHVFAIVAPEKREEPAEEPEVKPAEEAAQPVAEEPEEAAAPGEPEAQAVKAPAPKETPVTKKPEGIPTIYIVGGIAAVAGIILLLVLQRRRG